jgi:hypothetical protein
MRTPLLLGAVVNVVNVVGNYVLIFGHFGFPQMGVRGCGIASSAAFAVGLVLALAVMLRSETALRLRRDALRPNLEIARRMLRIGFPAATEQLFLQFGFFLYLITAAHYGTKAMAAYFIGVRFLALCFLPGLGFGAAAGTIVGQALGAGERGESLAAELAGRLTELAEAARARPERPRVACVEWIDPLMAAGNWMPELVTLAGGVNLFGEIGQHSPWLAWEALRDADPDVVVVLPCGFDLSRTRKEIGPLRAQPGFASLRAVREGRVFLADGHRFMNRPGPRMVESLEILCEILQPDAFPPRWRGDAWERL